MSSDAEAASPVNQISRPATSARTQRRAPPSSSVSTENDFCFNGLEVDDDNPAVASLKNSIAGMLAPMGILSVSVSEPDEIADARARIQGQAHAYVHISDGTPHSCQCGYAVQNIAPASTPECPVCVLLDG